MYRYKVGINYRKRELGQNCNGKAETHYRYDALGRRIEKQKQHSQAGRNHYTETTQYGWDGDTLAYESTNLYTKHYVYEKGSFVPLIQATYRQQINQHQTPQWDERGSAKHCFARAQDVAKRSGLRL